MVCDHVAGILGQKCTLRPGHTGDHQLWKRGKLVSAWQNQRTSEGTVRHRMRSPGVSWCGDYGPNEGLTDVRENVTCPQCVVDHVVDQNQPPATSKRVLEPRSAKDAEEAFSMPVLEAPPEGHRTVVSYGKDGVKVSTEPTANPRVSGVDAARPGGNYTAIGPYRICAHGYYVPDPPCAECRNEPRMADAKSGDAVWVSGHEAGKRTGAENERDIIISWLREYADEAEMIPGPAQYEDALRNAADSIESGEHLEDSRTTQEGRSSSPASGEKGGDR